MAKRSPRGRRGHDPQQRASATEPFEPAATARATVSAPGVSLPVPVSGPASAPATLTVAAPVPAPGPDPAPVYPITNASEMRMLGVALVGAAGTAGALAAVGVTLWAAVPLSLLLGFYGFVFGATLQVPHSRTPEWSMVEGSPPEEVQEAIRTAAEQVRSLGLEPRGVAYARNDSAEQYVWCADHPERHEAAAVVVERNLIWKGKPFEASLSFATRLKGGHRIGTVCSPDPQCAVGHRGS